MADQSPSRQPLYLKLLFEEVKLWRSYDEPSELGGDADGLLDQLFRRLKREQIGSPNIQSPAVTVMRDKEHLKTMAIAEHARWTAERRRDGWVAGPDNSKASRNDALKVHICLFPWDELTKAQQQQDIDAVISIPEFLSSAGYEIIKLSPETLAMPTIFLSHARIASSLRRDVV